MYQSYLHPTLYSPATRSPKDLTELINQRSIQDEAGKKYDGVWRVVICTEDSVAEQDVAQAMENLANTLLGIDCETKICTYVRVRNLEILRQALDMRDIDKVTGFVVPKADTTFGLYADQVIDTDFKLMPILESPHMVDHHFREALRSTLMNYKESIDCVRIGANDMLGHLGIRRDPHELSVYEGPVGQTIFSIINEFRGICGFPITAPVFECIDMKYDLLLRREVHQSITHGLFGQTVIHPRHLRIIRDLYKVDPDDLESAETMLANQKAVNGLHGRMDEYTTHWRWAERIVERASLFGTTNAVPVKSVAV